MVDYIPTTNMSLTVPITGVTVGPNWANEINASFGIVDAHDHSTGKGVPVTPAGLNINSDLPFGGNNANTVRTVRFSNPNVQPAGTTDVNCVYAFGGNLYYNNGGFAVQVTNGHSVAGTPGSIAGLVSPATATYIAISTAFVWQSDANTPAILDGASVILRNLSANSKGLTLSPPAAMAADFTITLPALPVATALTTISNVGTMGTTTPDGTTIINTGTVLEVGTISQSNVVGGFGLIPTGAMIPYGGTAAPTGYLLCDGTSYTRASQASLFTAIGTAYGAADGTHFNVPDLRGQFLRGVDGTAGRDPDKASRTAMATGGNTGNNVGSVQGFATEDHHHSATVFTAGGGGTGIAGDSNAFFGTSNTAGMSTGTASTETRPTNAYVNYIIKT